MEYSCFFFFNDTATTEIYTLSLHDALPIFPGMFRAMFKPRDIFLHDGKTLRRIQIGSGVQAARSEEHTSELQSRQYLVCRLLLEKKKTLLSLNLAIFDTVCDITWYEKFTQL